MKRSHITNEKSVFHLFQHLLILLLLATFLTGCESKRVIVNNLDEREANEILVFLAARNIQATKIAAVSEGAGASKGTMWNISVETSQANEAMAYLNRAGLPRRRGPSLSDIIGSQGLVSSATQDKARYQLALEEQIANTIRKIDGILDADVRLSIPEEDPLNPGAPKQKVTASVFVQHSGILDDPNAHLVTRIKRLVAGAVPNLSFDNVTIIGDRVKSSELSPFPELEIPFVRVWSLKIAQESLFRFRMMFFSFIIITLILLLALFWLLWKLMPFVTKSGGIKSLFSFQPLDTTTTPEKEPEKEENPNVEEDAQPKEERPPSDKIL